MSNMWNWKSNGADFNTFIVTGTINSIHGSLSPEERFEQTLDTLKSVRDKDPSAKILYVDNSLQPLSKDIVEKILPLVDVFEQMPHNVFSLIANIHRWKSPGEANLLHHALMLIRKHNMVGKRIFKLAGRYKLSDSFDISTYNDTKFANKYAFVANHYNLTADNYFTTRHVWFLEQTLISLDPFLIDEFSKLLIGMTHYMITTEACIEETMAQFIPMEKSVVIEKSHVEGLKADDKAVKQE